MAIKNQFIVYEIKKNMEDIVSFKEFMRFDSEKQANDWAENYVENSRGFREFTVIKSISK